MEPRTSQVISVLDGPMELTDALDIYAYHISALCGAAS